MPRASLGESQQVSTDCGLLSIMTTSVDGKGLEAMYGAVEECKTKEALAVVRHHDWSMAHLISVNI